MSDYTCATLRLQPYSTDAADLLASDLAEAGYETFEPCQLQSCLKAYIPAAAYDEAVLKEVVNTFMMPVVITYQAETIPSRDWNEEWERNYYKPIVIGNRCVVHSTFHTDVPKAEYDIVIDPRMAFGTGHHATTTQVMERLLDLPLEGKRVIDMGTGTAILAILASMRGARPVTGIEIDKDAYDNACDNIRLNHQSDILLIHGDARALDALRPADVFTANINRNVITADMARYAAALAPGGTMVLSGFYPQDVPIITAEAAKHGLELKEKGNLDGWSCITLTNA